MEKMGEKVKDEREPCYCQIAQMENKAIRSCVEDGHEFSS